MNGKYIKLKQKAIKLRRTGLSYGDIRKKLNVAKSTLSIWLKPILLKPEQRKKLYTKQIRILSKGTKSQKAKREKEVKQIISEAKNAIEHPLSLDTLRLMGAALYWAEGSKGKRVQITNSDPRLVVFMVYWFEEIFLVKARNLTARLNIYPQQNEKKIIRFWSELLGIPPENFGKSYIKPQSKGFKKNNLYYGTIRIEVPKSTDNSYRINGWINGALKNFDDRTSNLQNRWKTLRNKTRPVNLENMRP